MVITLDTTLYMTILGHTPYKKLHTRHLNYYVKGFTPIFNKILRLDLETVVLDMCTCDRANIFFRCIIRFNNDSHPDERFTFWFLINVVCINERVSRKYNKNKE